MIDEHETEGKWKIQLTMAINSISSKDSNGTRTIHSKSNTIEIMIGYETDEIIEELFESFLQKYQGRFEERMRGSEFVFDGIDLLHYKLHKISLNRGGSYIDFPKWLKNKRSTINLKNHDGKCFQYAITTFLNHESINVLYVPYNTEEIRPAHVSKYNSILKNHSSSDY